MNVALMQIGELKKGINPLSIMDLNFDTRYLSGTIRTGIVTGIIALAVRISSTHHFIYLFIYFVWK